MSKYMLEVPPPAIAIKNSEQALSGQHPFTLTGDNNVTVKGSNPSTTGANVANTNSETEMKSST